MADLTFNPKNRYVALIWNRTISPTMTNEARVNWTRLIANQFTSNPNVAWDLPRFEIEDMQSAATKNGQHRGPTPPAFFRKTSLNLRNGFPNSRVHNA